MNLCMPCRFQIKDIYHYIELNSRYKDSGTKIYEVYGAINPHRFGTARHKLALPVADFDQLKELVALCGSNGIQFNYLLNASCYQNIECSGEREKLFELITSLTQIGVNIFTITVPSLIYLIRKKFPDIHICVSAVYGCDSEKAYDEMTYYGVDRIVLDENANRNFVLLERLAKLTIPIELIGGTICLQDCACKPFHYNYLSESYYGYPETYKANFYSLRCELIKISNIENILAAPWIRPEDVGYYEDIGINHLKLPGRDLEISNQFIIPNAFFKRSFSGNFFDLWSGFSQGAISQIFYLSNKHLNGLIDTLRNSGEQAYKYAMEEVKRHIVVDEDRLAEYKALLKQRLEEFCTAKSVL